MSSNLKWAKMLYYIQLALNTSVCEIRKFSAYYLMFGRISPLTREIVHPSGDELINPDRYARELAQRCKTSFDR